MQGFQVIHVLSFVLLVHFFLALGQLELLRLKNDWLS